LGLAVHGALELAGKIWMSEKKFSAKHKDEIVDLYHRLAVREGIQDMSIYKEGERLLKTRLNSFSLGKDILGLEVKFGFAGGPDVLTPKGVPLLGSIDKVIAYDDDTLLVIDYKTSKTIPTLDKLKYDIQLSIYDLVASVTWPEFKRVILGLDMLRSSDILYTYRTPEERVDFDEYLLVLYNEMLSFTKKDARPQLNIFCPWCDYREYCDEYKKACKKSDYKFLSTMSLSDEDLIKEWKEVKSVKKILEMREQELEMVLTEKIRKFDMNPQCGDEEIYIRQNSRTIYDKEKVAKFLDYKEFLSVVNSIDKKSIEAFMDKNPLLREQLIKEQAFTVSHTSPFLALRKIKNGKGENGDVDVE